MSSASTKTITAGRRVAILGIAALFILSAFFIMPTGDETDASVSQVTRTELTFTPSSGTVVDTDGDVLFEWTVEQYGSGMVEVSVGNATTNRGYAKYDNVNGTYSAMQMRDLRDGMYNLGGMSSFGGDSAVGYLYWVTSNTDDRNDATGCVVSQFTVTRETITVYTYTTTAAFDANGGTGVPTTLSNTQEFESTSTQTVDLGVPDTVPTREGYDFLGWSTSVGGPVDYAPGASITTQIGNDLTLYAQWREQAATVTFMSNDSIYTTVSVPIGQTVSMPDDPTLYGYTFKGWYTDNTLVTEFDTSTLITGDMTLYAKWEGNLEFTTDPIADGIVTSVSGSPGTVLFSATGSQDYTSLVWDFGDGSTSTNTYVTHYYSQPGTYTASLTVYNNYGEDTTYFTIEVPDSTTGGGDSDLLLWIAVGLIAVIAGGLVLRRVL